MARTHARILTKIWRDEEFRALPVAPQHAYFTFLSQQELSHAGVIDYRAGRIGSLATDSNAKKIDVAVTRLEQKRFVVVDRATEELMVRTFIRHDGVLDRENMGKAFAAAYDRVVSLTIRGAILTELGRLYADKPHLKGWAGFASLNPDDYDRVLAMSSTIPLPIASGKA